MENPTPLLLCHILYSSPLPSVRPYRSPTSTYGHTETPACSIRAYYNNHKYFHVRTE